MEKCLIVAMGEDRAIGRGGTMPWHLRADLQYFKRITMGCPVIMGRTTFESIGRPLPGRPNIVLTRSQTPIPGTTCVPSIEAAYAAAERAPRVFIIGGASVYRQFLPYVDTVHVTKIDRAPASDSFFENLDASPDFRIRETGDWQEENGVRYQFVTYERIR